MFTMYGTLRERRIWKNMNSAKKVIIWHPNWPSIIAFTGTNKCSKHDNHRAQIYILHFKTAYVKPYIPKIFLGGGKPF